MILHCMLLLGIHQSNGNQIQQTYWQNWHSHWRHWRHQVAKLPMEEIRQVAKSESKTKCHLCWHPSYLVSQCNLVNIDSIWLFCKSTYPPIAFWSGKKLRFKSFHCQIVLLFLVEYFNQMGIVRFSASTKPLGFSPCHWSCCVE